MDNTTEGDRDLFRRGELPRVYDVIRLFSDNVTMNEWSSLEGVFWNGTIEDATTR